VHIEFVTEKLGLQSVLCVSKECAYIPCLIELGNLQISINLSLGRYISLQSHQCNTLIIGSILPIMFLSNYTIDELITAACNNVNIISFWNNEDGFNMEIGGIRRSDRVCWVCVNLTDCPDSQHSIAKNTTANAETGGAVTIGVHNATFYGNNITVTVQSCLACNLLKYYLPNVKLTC
jgi:hypothetical protein